MNLSASRYVLAGAIVLALAFPGWAVEATKGASAQEAKVEKKAVAKSNKEVKKLQEALKAKGEDPGAIDGVMGKKTREAIKAFQAANGLKTTGKLDDQTAEKLGVEKSNAAKKEMKETKK